MAKSDKEKRTSEALTLDELNEQIEAFKQDPRVIAYRMQKAEEEKAATDERYRLQREERRAFEERVKAFNEAHRRT